MVSVIIPIFNGAKTLEKCLISVLMQNYSSFEVIAVDNNSTDNTEQIVRYFQKKYSNLKYVFEQRRSRGVARNAGICAAKGEIIAMTDSDCIVPNNWIETIAFVITKSNKSLLVGGEKPAIKNYLTKQIQQLNQKHIQLYTRGTCIEIIDSKNFAVRTTLIKNNLFDMALCAGEDFDLSIRLRKAGVSFYYLPELSVKHFHKTSLIQWTARVYEQGYWLHKIYYKYQNNKVILQDPQFTNISQGFFKYFYRISNECLYSPILYLFFIFFTGTALYWGAFASRTNSNTKYEVYNIGFFFLPLIIFILLPIVLLFIIVQFIKALIRVFYVRIKILHETVSKLFGKYGTYIRSLSPSSYRLIKYFERGYGAEIIVSITIFVFFVLSFTAIRLLFL